jgi:hypothetical protein
MRELFPQFLHFVVLYDSLLLDSSSLASVDDRSIGEDSVTREAALREFINVLNEIIGHQIIETDSYGFGRGGRSKSFELGLEFRDVYAEVARLVTTAVSDEGCARRLEAVGVPWAYRDAGHYERKSFEQAAQSVGLAPSGFHSRSLLGEASGTRNLRR